jgi:hypothetical protein
LLANLVYFMYAWYQDGHIAYVGFVLCLCMQGNGRARKGRSMELGGVGEGGAIGRNGTSPPPGSAAAMAPQQHLTPMAPLLLLVSAPQQHPAPMAPPLPLASAPQQHPGVMPPPVQLLATAAQDQLNLMAPPFHPRPKPPALLLPVKMPPPQPMLIEQDESHDLKWSVLLLASAGRAHPCLSRRNVGVPVLPQGSQAMDHS